LLFVNKHVRTTVSMSAQLQVQSGHGPNIEVIPITQL